MEDGGLVVNGWIWERGKRRFHHVVPLEVMLDAVQNAMTLALSTDRRLPIFWQRPRTESRIGDLRQVQLYGDRVLAAGVVDPQTPSGAVLMEMYRSMGTISGITMRPVAAEVMCSPSSPSRVVFFKLVGVCATLPEG